MLARGVTFPFLAELLKTLFVEVADADFRIGNKASTDSRINLMTGVHRKDVSRLRQALQSPDDSVPSVVSLGAQLVAGNTTISRWGRPSTSSSPFCQRRRRTLLRELGCQCQ